MDNVLKALLKKVAWWGGFLAILQAIIHVGRIKMYRDRQVVFLEQLGNADAAKRLAAQDVEGFAKLPWGTLYHAARSIQQCLPGPRKI